MDILKVPLRDIHQWQDNPRTSENTEINELRGSLQTFGFEGVFLITKEPQSGVYVPYRGGNTTLQIMRELYEKHGDSRFAHLNCQVKKWPGHKAMLAKAHTENTARGEMSFTDTATSLVNILRSHFGDDDSHLKVSSTTLLNILEKEGISVTKRRLLVSIKFVFHIKDYIYGSFSEESLTLSDAEKILKIKANYEEMVNNWKLHITEVPKNFSEILSLLHFGDDLLDLELSVKREIGHWAQVNEHEVSAAYRAIVNGGEPSFPMAPMDKEGAKEQRKSPVASGKSDVNCSPEKENSVIEIARSICEAHGINECYRETGCGVGFYVELPENDFSKPQESLHWWVMFVFSGVMDNEILRQLNPDSQVVKAVKRGQIKTLYGKIGSKPISASMFYRTITRNKDYRRLMGAILEVQCD